MVNLGIYLDINQIIRNNEKISINFNLTNNMASTIIDKELNPIKLRLMSSGGVL